MKKLIIWASLVAVGLFITGAGYAAIDPASIMGLWLFDGDASDGSGNGNDGTLMGDTVFVDGRFGQAVEFDGDEDYVDVADSDSLDMSGEMTVALWFKTDKDMVDMFGDRQCVIGKHYLEYEVGIYTEGQVHTYNSDSAGGYDEGVLASIADAFGEATWTLGEWYHLAWTLSGVHEIAYINGVVIGEFDKPNAGTQPGEHALNIGQRSEGGMPFTGAIDEVVLLNKALGEADIQSIMNGILNPTAVSPADSLTATWGNIKK